MAKWMLASEGKCGVDGCDETCGGGTEKQGKGGYMHAILQAQAPMM
jgi:hypothetical protein